MPRKDVSPVAWYRDPTKDAPPLVHSYVAALATSLQARGEPVDLTELMGASGWAFRIIAHEDLCPSATSVFDWGTILPETVRQAGYEVTHLLAFGKEQRQELRPQALDAIRTALDGGTLPVAWDIQEPPEWGVITGYDDDARLLQTQYEGRPATLPYGGLGEREIALLSVIIPGRSQPRSPEAIIREALGIAVRHARQQEWMERPAYQDGLAAYGQWARALTKEADATNWGMAWYCGVTWYAARWYATRWLERRAAELPGLAEAAAAYGEVRDHLRVVWQGLRSGEQASPEAAAMLAQELDAAQAAEERGVQGIERFLAQG